MSSGTTFTKQSAFRLPTGFLMPKLGLGVYRNDDCKPACLAALKDGYRHIDSARMYKNEKQVGEAVRESGIKREDIFITSKIPSPDHGYERCLTLIDQSLLDFGFDYIDLYLIHDPLAGTEKRIATYRALLEAKKQRKIRTVGVSNYSVKHLEEIKEAGLETPAINQIELHPFCQQRPIVEYCEKNNIIIQAYCPLVRGQFDNPTLQSVSKKHSKGVANILLRWSLQKGFSPLPKSSQPSRVVSNADVYDFELDGDDMAAIAALDQGKAGGISWNPVDAD